MVQRCDEGAFIHETLHVPLGCHELWLQALRRDRLPVQQAFLHYGAGALAQYADLRSPSQY